MAQHKSLPSAKEHSLCAVCQRMIRRSSVLQYLSIPGPVLVYKTEFLKHHKQAADLERSALGRCHLCALLFADGFTQPGCSSTKSGP